MNVAEIAHHENVAWPAARAAAALLARQREREIAERR